MIVKQPKQLKVDRINHVQFLRDARTLNGYEPASAPSDATTWRRRSSPLPTPRQLTEAREAAKDHWNLDDPELAKELK